MGAGGQGAPFGAPAADCGLDDQPAGSVNTAESCSPAARVGEWASQNDSHQHAGAGNRANEWNAARGSDSWQQPGDSWRQPGSSWREGGEGEGGLEMVGGAPQGGFQGRFQGSFQGGFEGGSSEGLRARHFNEGTAPGPGGEYSTVYSTGYRGNTDFPRQDEPPPWQSERPWEEEGGPPPLAPHMMDLRPNEGPARLNINFEGTGSKWGGRNYPWTSDLEVSANTTVQ